MAENIFTKWKESLDRTRKASFGRIAAFLGTSEITDETWNDLEGLLLQSDLGVETTRSVLENLKKAVVTEGLTRSEELLKLLEQELLADEKELAELPAIHIPVSAKVESLNVSTAGAIILIEAFRQRNAS